ncbi:MAG: vWA domain-containing protein [Pseudomonadota bacterium]
MRKIISACNIIMILFTFCLFQGRAQSQETDMVILVDRSGSMDFKGGDPDGLSRAAVEFLLDQLELASDGNRCAFVLFDSKTRTIPKTGLTDDFSVLRDGLNMISETGGNTDLEEALNVGLGILAKSGSNRQMVLISDGKPEPDFTSAHAAERFPDELALWRKTSSLAKKREIMQKLSDLSATKIQNLMFDVLRENNIELYPIALTGIQASGEELLRAMAIEVTHNAAAFKKVQGHDLISGLDEIVPKPVGVMNICRANLESAGKNRWSVDFELDNSLQKVRVLMLYRYSPGDLKWTLKGPSGTITRDKPKYARYAKASDKNGKGKMIFERIFMDNPTQGHYTLEMVSSRFIPPTQVIIEGRTDLRLAVVADPNPAEVSQPVSIYCRLEGSGAGRLESAEAYILDAKGESVVRGLSFLPDTGQALNATWTPETYGQYVINIKGYIDSDHKRYLNTRYPLTVEPRQPIKLHIQIPVRSGEISVAGAQHPQKLSEKGPTLDPKGGMLQFGNFSPDHRKYTIEGITITQDRPRSAQVKIRIIGLRHQETNFLLEPEKWCVLSPSEGSVSKDESFKFNFTIGIPKKIPAGIPDGLYVGNLKIECQDAASPLKRPIAFTLDLPDFIPVPVDLADQGIDVEMSCCLPGKRKVSFDLTTDAMHEQIIKVMAPLMLIQEETGESFPPEQAWVTILPEGTQVAEKVVAPGKKPTPISLVTHVANEQMQEGVYNGDIVVRSEMGRTLYIPIHLKIPSSFLVEKIKTYFMAAAGLVLFCIFVFPCRRLIQGRNRFRGSIVPIRFVNQVIRIPSPWNRILEVSKIPNQGAWRVTSNTGYEITAENPDPFAHPNTVTVEDSQPKSIHVIRGRERYGLRASGNDFRLNLRITESPHRRGRILLRLFFWSCLLAILSFSSLRPDIWCCFF